MQRHRARLRWSIVVLVSVVIVGSGTAYAVTADGSAGNYRTVRAANGDVEQTLQTSGILDAAQRADLEFATSGTVAEVEVAVGETVKAGQVLAVLDTDELQAAVARARASVAKAVAQLASDRDAQDATVTAAASTPRPSSNPGGSGAPSAHGASGTAAALAELQGEQDDVIKAQSAATAAISAAKDALTAQTEACAAAYQDPAPATPTPATSTPSDDPTPGDDATAGAAASAADDRNAGCSAALAGVQHRQGDVSAAQEALATALGKLAASLTKAVISLSAASRSTPSSSTPSRSTPSRSAPTTSVASGATHSASSADGSFSGTVSAARLAADQAQIAQANADLVGAREQLGQAVVRSTRSGKVAALDATQGAKVSAGDTAAVVVGGKAVTVVADIDESRIDQVKVGQVVQVTTPGASDSAEGIVTAIGLVADSSSGTASYPVTVTVEDPTISLPTGSRATVAIVVATAKDVVTVPTSAITRRGDRALVRLWNGKDLTLESVTIGTVGVRLVEITQGLSAGDEVVLADLDQPITGASDTINDRGGFGGGRSGFQFDGGGRSGGSPGIVNRAN